MGYVPIRVCAMRYLRYSIDFDVFFPILMKSVDLNICLSVSEKNHLTDFDDFFLLV